MKAKEGVNISDIFKMHINVLAMLAFYFAYAANHGLTAYITSLMTDLVTGRTRLTHLDGRAADVHMHSWPILNRIDFEKKFEEKFKDVGAITKNGVNAIEIHGDGYNLHGHLQCRS